ncbi:MAG: nucleoside triphosphate pyrophosphohydrolase family protein [Alistipes sp.]|nr:nucleoside triphosphate pyrophosphohydrolase family protein [Alistipes sp.]MBR3794389.1 nucleoside triphosphate pyrophosphohydrolase family protein [Alistipes sp.]
MSKELSLNEYQRRAMETCLPTANNFSYMMLNLVGEVGEFASKVAKAIRKDQLGILKGDLYVREKGKENFLDTNNELMAEAGDILWQLSGLCSVMGWPLDEVAEANLDKLASRKQRNVIDGNGDNR